MSSSNPVVTHLYRSLLRASKPFTHPYPEARLRNALLHRSGEEDPQWDEFLRRQVPSAPAVLDETQVFRQLLRELVNGDVSDGLRQIQLPSQVDTTRLWRMIRREFREPSISAEHLDGRKRQEVAFWALRELNKKLCWADQCKPLARHPQQAARHVKPTSVPHSGAYLVAHPMLTGFFRKSVICILDYQPEGEEKYPRKYGAYGVIINREAFSPSLGKNLTLDETLQSLPEDIVTAFGDSTIREGGPVNLSFQMVYSATPEQDELQIGGTVILPSLADETKSAAEYTDRAVKYNGDVIKAAQAVLDKQLDRDNVSFFVGASIWDPGQLESEMERGFWLLCQGPPDIALSGQCEHEQSSDDSTRPRADLWLSMMSAYGEDEAKLAHLLWAEDGEDPNGLPCDDFD